MAFLILVLLGLVSGTAAGLLGIGGGFIIVPALYYFFLWQQHPSVEVMHIVLCTSLAAIVVTSAVASIAFLRRKGVDSSALWFLLPGLVIGSISGAGLVSLLNSAFLRIAFGFAVIPIGLYFIIPHFPIPVFTHKSGPIFILFGLVIGHLSSFLGIGGGIFTVPFLLSHQIPMNKVSGTSSLATFATSLVGTISYMLFAKKAHFSLPYTVGFIDIPSFLAISLGSIIATLFGVYLAHRMPIARIKQVFGITLCATGLVMIFI